MKTAILVLALTTSLPLFAIPKGAVVKVLSGRCGEAPPFIGSGVIIQNGNHGAVVTSDHVVFNSAEPFCHTIRTADKKDTPARLIVSDAGKGLALLELTEKNDLPAISIQDISLKLPAKGAGVTTTGFPARSYQLVWDSGKNISVVDEKSGLAVLPSLSEVLEVSGADGQKGMSGAPLLNADGTDVVGILTAVVRDNSHLLAIPGNIVEEFVRRNLIGGVPARPQFSRNATDQEIGRDILFSGGLSFEAVLPEPVIQSLGSADGIGGPMKAISVKVNWADDSTTEWPFTARDTWREHIRNRANRLSTHLEAKCFIKRTAGGELERIPFYSLTEFFHLLGDASLSPVLVDSEANQNPEKLEKLFADLREQIAFFDKVEDVKARAVLSELSLLVDMQNSEPSDLTSEDFQAVLTDTSRWAQLFLVDVARAAELGASCRRARDVLPRRYPK